jgi:hypothetical protein
MSGKIHGTAPPQPRSTALPPHAQCPHFLKCDQSRIPHFLKYEQASSKGWNVPEETLAVWAYSGATLSRIALVCLRARRS